MKLRHFENVFETQFDSKGTACNDDLWFFYSIPPKTYVMNRK